MVQVPPGDEMRIGGQPQDCEGDGLDPSVRRSSLCERANRTELAMFAFGTKQTWASALQMSAIGSKADIARALRNVRLWPKADILVLPGTGTSA